MARKLGKRDSRYLARLVTGDRAPCAFCNRNVDDEVTYGKLYAIGDIHCHYFCALLSCCLIQKGSDEDGLFGFLYKDILAELERSKKHKCSYCCQGGASMGCAVTSCRKQFHMPCGRERNAVSLYYGTYKSFCQMHAPKQVIPEHIMCKARLRMRASKMQKCPNGSKSTSSVNGECDKGDEEMVCVICYESVAGFPAVDTFWPPCCARDAWFHRTCLQRMALSAGMHYLKCPLCNDKANFYEAVVSQGYYVPDRDAAWELEQNAFAEIYERPLNCAAEQCRCPMGRGHDEQGPWDFKLCLLCGSVGAHAECIGASEATRYICLTCTPAAPKDIQALADTIEELIQQEQVNAANSARRGPVMPSRMSLRRTKPRPQLARPSSSRDHDVRRQSELPAHNQTQAGRQELNLGTPRKLSTNADRRDSSKNDINSPLKNIDSHKDYERLMSPMKLLEQSFKEKVLNMGMNNAILDEQIVDMLKNKFMKPRPLSEKKKIVEDILDNLFDTMNSVKPKGPPKEWMSPRKSLDKDNETCENTPKVYKDTVQNPLETPKKSKIVTAPNIIVEVPDYISIDEIKQEHDVDLAISSEIEPDCIKKELSIALNDNQNELNSNESKENGNANLQDMNLENVEENHVARLFIEVTAKRDKTSCDAPEFASKIVSQSFNANFAIETHHRKTVDIQHDSSLEISEKEQSVSIDIIKNNNITDIPIKDNLNTPNNKHLTEDKKKIAFKFSPLDHEKLESTNVDIDLERFTKEYLNEVGREFKCCFSHNHDTTKTNTAYRTVVDFAIEAHKKYDNKRRLSDDNVALNAKRRKISENINVDTASTKVMEAVAETDIIRPKTKEISGVKNKRAKKFKRVRGTRITRAYIKERNTTPEVKDEEYQIKDELSGKDDVSTHNESNSLDEIGKDTTESINENVKAKKVDKTKRLKIKIKENVKRKKNPEKKRADVRDESEKELSKKKRREIFNDQKREIHSKIKKRRSGAVAKVRRVNRNIEFTIDQEETPKKYNKNKTKTKLSISNDEKDISVKIHWKRQQLRLKIESKNVRKVDNTKLKQYVLQCYPEAMSKKVLVKPEKEVSPLKRKYVKHEKFSPDKYKQTSIQNFFKVKASGEK